MKSDKKNGDNNHSGKLSRRSFLKAASVVGASGALGPFVFTPKKARALGKNPPSHPISVNTLIIGSGFGGAISALRLCQRGIETTILEKGKRWDLLPDGNTFSPYIYPDGRSTWLNHTTVVPLGPPLPINKYTGVLEGHDMAHLRILTGSAYGGGSMVYGSLHVKPPQHLFEQVFPQEVSYEDLEPYFQRVDQKIGISKAPDDVFQSEYFTHYRVMEDHCANTNLQVDRIRTASRWDIVRDEINGTIKPSVIHGEAIYGVNSGAKKTLDQTYLKEAEDSGYLTVKTLRRVTDIAWHEGQYLVFVEHINERGRVLEEEVYSCHSLFMAAGSIGTSKLLVRAKATGLLPDLNQHVGQGWANNGNVYALRVGLKESTGRWQGGPPSSAIKYYDNPISPLYIEHPQLPLGLDLHFLLYFGMGIHNTRGQFHYNPIKNKVELSWPRFQNDQAKINRAMMHTMDELNQANGGRTSSLIGGRKGYRDDSVYHPLGGAVIGKATDFYGRVKNYPRLYINDGSLLPGFTGCANPCLTISAIAERNIERILQEDF